MRIVYDFGANTGQDVEYYLLKADRVIAVEANPQLCQVISTNYSSAVSEGRLVVVNKALYVPEDGGDVPATIELNIPKSGAKAGLSSSHSTIVKPSEIRSEFFADPLAYDQIDVPAATPSQIVSEHGFPHYIKIDIEHYDHHVLRELLSKNICPRYISSECHNAEVLGLFLSSRRYDCFKLVEGGRLSDDYASAEIDVYPPALGVGRAAMSSGDASNVVTISIKCTYKFTNGMSGPFGDDVCGSWMNPNDLFSAISSIGLGWIDVHAKLSE